MRFAKTIGTIVSCAALMLQLIIINPACAHSNLISCDSLAETINQQRQFGEEYVEANLLNNYGVCLIKKEQYEAAIMQITQALTKDSSQWQFFFNLGLAQFKSEKFEEAAFSFEAVKARNNADASVDLLLAKSYEQSGALTSAVKCYESYNAREDKTESVDKHIMMLKASVFISEYWYYLLAAAACLIAILVVLIIRRGESDSEALATGA